VAMSIVTLVTIKMKLVGNDKKILTILEQLC
jgi:hypothetical protein